MPAECTWVTRAKAGTLPIKPRGAVTPPLWRIPRPADAIGTRDYPAPRTYHPLVDSRPRVTKGTDR